ncbi:hypothetical protein FK268_12650 [Tsukamurella sputi]|uniref:Uncharacterized protein n=1 Tax=Tsukamurella sputi TaxID=2591848 RepID=A0A5C5RP81_9ACTN|nr:hypothetical protein FK268_12650 [Tsukamurella sputi]
MNIDRDALEGVPVTPSGPLSLDQLAALIDLAEHTGEHITLDADTLASGRKHLPENVSDLFYCMDQVSPATVGHLVQCWGALHAILHHLRESASELTAVASIRLVIGHHGGAGGIEPNGWQTELIALIERGDTLQRASLTAAYPGLVQAVSVQEAEGMNALYALLARALLENMG